MMCISDSFYGYAVVFEFYFISLDQIYKTLN